MCCTGEPIGDYSSRVTVTGHPKWNAQGQSGSRLPKTRAGHVVAPRDRWHLDPPRDRQEEQRRRRRWDQRCLRHSAAPSLACGHAQLWQRSPIPVTAGGRPPAPRFCPASLRQRRSLPSEFRKPSIHSSPLLRGCGDLPIYHRGGSSRRERPARSPSRSLPLIE